MRVMTMQRHQDTNGRGRWIGLLGVSALALLAGCDWIGGGPGVSGPPPRPGAEKAVQPSASLPPAPPNPQYDAAVVSNEERASPIGSVVAAKGGQKAQREAIEKEQADRDRKDREARLEREAADKAADKEEKTREKQEGTPPGVAPVGAPPAGAGTITSDQPPVSAPVPPPAPVTTAPMAPPAAPEAAPPETIPQPSSPPAADPNKAFAPPPGWTPPGIDVGSVVTLAPLTVAFTESADDACADPTPLKGDIAVARSGEGPVSALKSTPLDVPASQRFAEAVSDDEPVYQASPARGLAANRRADVFIDF